MLHIGTEKTGSTAIQICLYNRRDRIGQHGFAVSDLMGQPPNRKLAAYFQDGIDDYLKDRGIKDAESRAKHFEGFWDGLADEFQKLEQSGFHTLIVSSEHFHSRLRDPGGIARLRDHLSSHFSSVTVLCYIREQSAVRRGLYSTSVRNGFTGGIDAFQPKIRPGNHYYDYCLFLDKWAEVFGKDALSIALFDRSKLTEGDIRRDFFKRIEMPEFTEIPLVDVRVNESLALGQSLACRMINRAIPRYDSSGKLDQTRIALREEMLLRPALRIGSISDSLAREIYDRFAEVNDDVGRRYLGLEGNPFERPETANDSDFEMTNCEMDQLVRSELRVVMATLAEKGISRASLKPLDLEISGGVFS